MGPTRQELLFLVRVHDDHVLAGESLEQNDAVGLTARRVGEGGEHPVRFVLTPGGQVRTILSTLERVFPLLAR